MERPLPALLPWIHPHHRGPRETRSIYAKKKVRKDVIFTRSHDVPRLVSEHVALYPAVTKGSTPETRRRPLATQHDRHDMDHSHWKPDERHSSREVSSTSLGVLCTALKLRKRENLDNKHESNSPSSLPRVQKSTVRSGYCGCLQGTTDSIQQQLEQCTVKNKGKEDTWFSFLNVG